MNRLRGAVEKADLPQVTIIEGHAEDASLPESCCDALFMRNVYHHFQDPAVMNASLYKALKTGGRIAIIDFPRGNAPTAAPGQRAERSAHGVGAEIVANELKAAGFEIVSSETRTNRWFVVVGAKGMK
ncbi:MAG: class I SAM-dependent methyltransferase [Acidobacteriota bacterium]